MKKYILFIFILSIVNSSKANCTDEKIQEEFTNITKAHEIYLADKNQRLNEILEQIKEKNKLTDKQVFDYRISLLQDESALKFKKKEPHLDLFYVISLKNNKKCGKLTKHQKKLVKQADKQWAIIFEKINSDLKAI